MISSVDDPKPKLIYVGDPMCSWCYGIAPELEKVLDHFSDQLDYELVVGGLRPYNDELMTDLKGFLTDHWKDVNQTSGQPFKYEVLNRSDLKYDTEPPCRASVTFRKYYPKQEFEFFARVQTAFYAQNKSVTDSETYLEIIREMNLDPQDFAEKFQSQDLKNAVKEDFRRAQFLGVRSFPTILLEKNGKTTVINQGYQSAKAMIEKIEKEL